MIHRLFTTLFLILALAAVCCTASDVGCSADLPGAGTDHDATDSGLCMAPMPTHGTPSHATEGDMSSSSSSTPLTALDRIIARGRLICAHCDDTLGHSKVVSNTSATGMEPELCKGLAAAIGVEPSYWMMRAPSERFPLLQSREVDLSFALTSKTIQRDMYERGTFSIPYFNDQHNLMYRSDVGINGPADLRGKTICVTAGTTNPNVFGDYLASIASLIGGVDNCKVVSVKEDGEALDMMYENKCQGFVNDHSVVAGYISVTTPPEGVTYRLADWDGAPFARAPFSVVTLDGETEWSSIVDWFVNGLFLAEMYDITQSNVDERAADPSLPGEAQRLLGVQLVGGHKLRFDMNKAIRSIGNYAEVYQRNFGSFLHRTRANELYQNGGAVIPGGFR